MSTYARLAVVLATIAYAGAVSAVFLFVVLRQLRPENSYEEWERDWM
ncbi:hypothetical protein OHA25_47250 [Nonomuraea sp. NBC_00507]